MLTAKLTKEKIRREKNYPEIEIVMIVEIGIETRKGIEIRKRIKIRIEKRTK